MLFYRTRKSYFNKKKFLFYFISIAIIIAFSFIYFIKPYFNDEINNYDRIIFEKAKKYNLDPYLVKAVIWRESKFNANTTGSKGEIGLMQIMPSAALKDWEISKRRQIKYSGILYTPSLNIEIGCWYIARCRRHWKDYKDIFTLTLAEYNAGYSNVKKWVSDKDKNEKNLIDKIKFSTTKKYVRTILDKYKSLKDKS